MGEVLVLAWLREWRSMKSIFRLDAETTSEEIERTRSLPQGDPAAPMLFNIILDTLAVRFERMARSNTWGDQLQGGTSVDLSLFADNYWLVAADHKMLESMTVACLSPLGEYGWGTPLEELTCCTKAEDDGLLVINIDKKNTKRATAHDGSGTWALSSPPTTSSRSSWRTG